MAAVSGQGRDVHKAQDPLSSYISHPARDGGARLRALRGCRGGDVVDTPAEGAVAGPASRAAGCVCAQGLHVRVSQLRARSGRRSSTWGRVVPPRGPPPPRLRGFHQPLRMEARSPVLLPHAAGPHPKEGVASPSPHGPGPLGDMHTSQNSAASSPYRVPTSLASSCQEILRESDTHRRASAGHPPAVGP